MLLLQSSIDLHLDMSAPSSSAVVLASSTPIEHHSVIGILPVSSPPFQKAIRHPN